MTNAPEHDKEKEPQDINEDQEDDNEEEPGARPESVETFSAPVGVIEPPPDLKAVVDRTADFVRRVGSQFEAEIKQRNSRSTKFGFLDPSNPYHAYYRQRVQYGDEAPSSKAEGVSGIEPPKQKKKTEPSADAKAKKAPRVKTVSERLIEQLASVKLFPAPPEKLPLHVTTKRYAIKDPEGFLPVDVDIIKLTAQFVARNGRQFLSGLSNREQSNRQFDFLRPTHPLFGFFQQMVDAYSGVIIPPKDLLARLREQLASPTSFLTESLEHASYLRKLAQLEKDKAASEEQEREFMQTIDWHQFVIVETITFAPEDDAYLPAPRSSIEEINAMLASQDLGAELPSEATTVSVVGSELLSRWGVQGS